mmetsp:Transcript_15847/g.30073  ORF Transcript_15847/g.30073 Transcript_15847/m.30073 type:complete len:382 (-) Transcript_15847:251-1396(-)
MYARAPCDRLATRTELTLFRSPVIWHFFLLVVAVQTSCPVIRHLLFFPGFLGLLGLGRLRRCSFRGLCGPCGRLSGRCCGSLLLRILRFRRSLPLRLRRVLVVHVHLGHGAPHRGACAEALEQMRVDDGHDHAVVDTGSTGSSKRLGKGVEADAVLRVVHDHVLHARVVATVHRRDRVDDLHLLRVRFAQGRVEALVVEKHLGARQHGGELVGAKGVVALGILTDPFAAYGHRADVGAKVVDLLLNHGLGVLEGLYLLLDLVRRTLARALLVALGEIQLLLELGDLYVGVDHVIPLLLLDLVDGDALLPEHPQDLTQQASGGEGEGLGALVHLLHGHLRQLDVADPLLHIHGTVLDLVQHLLHCLHVPLRGAHALPLERVA